MAKPPPPHVAAWLARLTPIGPVRARAMFGGWGIYCEDVMFALIAGEELFFKVDAETEPQFAAAGSTPFVYHGKGTPVRMSYWRCPAAAVDDLAVFETFARLGVEAARRKGRLARKRR